MYKQRLFKRLRFFNENPHSRLKTHEVKYEIASIKEHLNKLLTSRVETSLIADDYGLVDISNIHNEYFSEFLKSLEIEIKKAVENYEPRLKDIKVSFIRTDDKRFNLNFEIEGMLRSDDSTKVLLHTIVYPEGKVFLNES